MTDTQDPAAPPTAIADSGSFVGNLFNLYFEPTETFSKIFVRPRVWMAMLLQVALGVGFSSIWLEKADVREFAKQKLEQSSRVQQMSAEQVEQALNLQTRIIRGAFRYAPFVAPAIAGLVVGGILMFVFRFFLAADVSFLQSFATTVWSFTAIALIHSPIALAVFWLKGDWNVDPNEIVQANPTLFFEVGAVPRWLWGFLSSVDLFSLWTVFLLATGHAVASKRGLSTCIWTVGVLWTLAVIVKVCFIVMFG